MPMPNLNYLGSPLGIQSRLSRTALLFLNYDPRKVLWSSTSTCCTREKGETIQTNIWPTEMDWSEVDDCGYLGYHGIHGICVYWTSLCANDQEEERCRCW
jgi:hypothetical protein